MDYFKALAVAVGLVAVLSVGALYCVHALAALRGTDQAKNEHLSCDAARIIQKFNTAVKGLHNESAKAQWFLVMHSGAPRSIRGSVRTYLGKYPTLASAQAVDRWAASCQPSTREGSP